MQHNDGKNKSFIRTYFNTTETHRVPLTDLIENTNMRYIIEIKMDGTETAVHSDSLIYQP